MTDETQPIPLNADKDPEPADAQVGLPSYDPADARVVVEADDADAAE